MQIYWWLEWDPKQWPQNHRSCAFNQPIFQLICLPTDLSTNQKESVIDLPTNWSIYQSNGMCDWSICQLIHLSTDLSTNWSVYLLIYLPIKRNVWLIYLPTDIFTNQMECVIDLSTNWSIYQSNGMCDWSIYQLIYLPIKWNVWLIYLPTDLSINWSIYQLICLPTYLSTNQKECVIDLSTNWSIYQSNEMCDWSTYQLIYLSIKWNVWLIYLPTDLSTNEMECVIDCCPSTFTDKLSMFERCKKK